MFILIITFVLLLPAAVVSDTKQGYTALSFGHTTEDYIQFQPDDMSPFASSFTVCSWTKRLQSAHLPILFHYNGGRGDIIMTSDGIMQQVNRDLVSPRENDLRGKFPEADVWFHHCLSWAAGRTLRVYINGVEVGRTTASSHNLTLGGSIGIGNVARHDRVWIFGGDVFKLNMFSEQLTSSQIREMADFGMCSEVEEKYETRKLKWEEILTKERQGYVTEFVPEECAVVYYINYMDTKLTQTEARLRKTEIELKQTKKTLKITNRRLNRELDRRESECGSV